MGRNVGHVGARTVADSEAKVLTLVPLFPGERVDRIQMDAIAATLGDTDVTNPIMMNWYGLGVPWEVLNTLEELSSGVQPDFSTVADYDQAYHQLMLNADEADVEFFGGDVDADPEDQTSEDPTNTSTEPALEDSPMGPYKWLSHEVLGRPFVAAGNDVVRHGDEFKAMIPGRKFQYHPWGQLLMFGMVRFEGATAETNFNVEKDDGTSIASLALLRSGQLGKIKAKIAGDTGLQGDYIRTILFGGDNYIESSTITGGDVKAYVKMRVHISGPLSRGMGQ